MRKIISCLVWGVLVWAGPTLAQTPEIVSTTPSQNELNVAPSGSISVTFDIDMDSTTINDSTFVVHARSTGLHLGTISYNGPTKTATLNPDEDFDAGELVTVVLTTDIESSAGDTLENSYAWSFTAMAGEAIGIFAHRSEYAVGSGARSVYMGDFDDDGNLDVVTADSEADSISVLLNNGDGTFAAHVQYQAGDGALAVIGADFDGDDDIDIATANFADDNVSVFLNYGDGSFAGHSTYPTGGAPNPIFAADFDGDGDIDLTTVNLYSGKASVLLNDGDASFSSFAEYSVDGDPNAVFAADLDNDGDMDLVTGNYDSTSSSVLMNNGDGVFALDSVYAISGTSSSVVAADLDGDGALDLANVNEDVDSVSILLNNGDGTFGSYVTYPTGDAPTALFAADYDGDLDIDLATANWNSNDASILLNDGNADFTFTGSCPVPSGIRGIFAGDIDDDHSIDLAIVKVDGTVSILSSADAGMAIDCDGLNDFVLIPGSSDYEFGTGDFAIEMWIQPTYIVGDFRVLVDNPIIDNLEIGLWGETENAQITFYGGGGETVWTPNLAWTLGQWYHIAVVRENGVVTIYRNAVQEASGSVAGVVGNSADLSFGYSASRNLHPFDGCIDEIRIWNIKRTSTEIADYYNKVIERDTPGLVGYWDFNEETDNQYVVDLTANENHGNLGGTPVIYDNDPLRVESTAPITNTLDSDDDGILNLNDNCPYAFNSAQEDGDGDNAGDSCDNCNSLYNPDQDDIDGDGIGDLCESIRTWQVSADGSGDAPTIQAAIDSCTHGDTVRQPRYRL